MIFYPSFTIRSEWCAANDTPSEIAARFERTLRLLGPLAPAMSNWLLIDPSEPRYVPLAEAAQDMAAFVERCVWTAADAVQPEPGYHVMAKGSPIPSERGGPDAVHLSVKAGSRTIDKAEFRIGGIRYPNDLALTTYPIYKGALLSLVSAWPCPWALAYESDEVSPVDAPKVSRERLRAPFEVVWIAYLSAPLVAGLAPPPEIAIEQTPGGGLVLTAVGERIDQSNPEHMRRSRMLEAILNDRVGLAQPPFIGIAKHPARVGPH